MMSIIITLQKLLSLPNLTTQPQIHCTEFCAWCKNEHSDNTVNSEWYIKDTLEPFHELGSPI
jgi:hypothetical protein